LRIEHESEPLAVSPDSVRFSWRVPGEVPDATQSAYRILVDRTATGAEERNGAVWDSGKRSSSRATDVAYDGPSLEHDRTYYWQVRVWNGEDEPSPYSEPARFSTAPGEESAWDAEWITHHDHGDRNGFRTPWRADPDASEWVRVDLGETRAIESIELVPAEPFDAQHTPDGGRVTVQDVDPDAVERDLPDTPPSNPLHYVEGIAGFGFPERYRILVSETPTREAATVLATQDHEDTSPPHTEPATVSGAGERARYVWVEATELYEYDPAGGQLVVDRSREEHRPWRVFALAGLAVRDGDDTDLARGQPVEASASVRDTGWAPEHLVDGHRSGRDVTSPQVRTTVELSESVERARVHVAALGYGEVHVNGERIGDAALNPPWTEFDERVLYRSEDVSEHLSAGENTLGVWLGRGRYAKNTLGWMGGGSPRCLLTATVEYADGTTRTISSDASWESAESPIVANDVYDGEHYDATLEDPEWARPGATGEDGDASQDWAQATVVDGPDGDLFAQRIEPMEVVETFDPVAVHDHDEGPILDFGQNLTGRVELPLSDPDRGQRVEIHHAETLSEDGSLSTVDLRSADAVDRYVAAGKREETYEPRFTSHGFRYAQVRGGGDAVSATDVRAKAVHTAMDRIGSFDCSNESLSQVQHNAVWGLRGNTHGIPEDCPQRDERFGWTGDAHISARSLLYNFDARRFHEKWMRDHDDTQSRHGYLGDTVPFGYGNKPADPTWSITRVVVPWYLYLHYGDEHVLSRHYERMCRYVEYWHSCTEGGILPAEYGKYGDWLSFENPRDDSVGRPFDLFNTAFHYQTVDVMGRVARVLGRDSDAVRFDAMGETLTTAFNDRFLDAEAGVYRPVTQSTQAVPLFLDLVPEDHEQKVLENLVSKITDADDGTLTAGFLGARPLLETLADRGHAELAYHLVSQPERPGWVYMVDNGATTMWERWDSDDRIGDGMNSLNHSPFTFVSEWFYRTLAGIRCAGNVPMTDRVEIAPRPVESLEWAEGSVETPNGSVVSAWERTGQELRLECTVPWNVTADVHLPGGAAGSVRADGSTLDATDPATYPAGVAAADPEGADLVLTADSGSYEFSVDRPSR
jgi:alpha-L-rhamnosidase